jgi:hypothetical protein
MTLRPGQFLFFIGLCFIVPVVTGIAPDKMTHSRIARLIIHVGCFGVAIAALACVSDGTVRRSLIGFACVALLQYWASVLLVGMYERRYDRAPGPVLFLVSRLGLEWRDRLMVLGWLLLWLGGVWAVGAVSKWSP